MKYTKPPLTIADQVELLQSRGMEGDPDRIAPNSRWANRVVELIDQQPNIPLEVMGMPLNWKEHSLWRGL